MYVIFQSIIVVYPWIPDCLSSRVLYLESKALQNAMLLSVAILFPEEVSFLHCEFQKFRKAVIIGSATPWTPPRIVSSQPQILELKTHPPSYSSLPPSVLHPSNCLLLPPTTQLSQRTKQRRTSNIPVRQGYYNFQKTV